MNNRRIAKELLVLAKSIISVQNYDEYLDSLKDKTKSKYRSEEQYNKAMGIEPKKEKPSEKPSVDVDKVKEDVGKQIVEKLDGNSSKVLEEAGINEENWEEKAYDENASAEQLDAMYTQFASKMWDDDDDYAWEGIEDIMKNENTTDETRKKIIDDGLSSKKFIDEARGFISEHVGYYGGDEAVSYAIDLMKKGDLSSAFLVDASRNDKLSSEMKENIVKSSVGTDNQEDVFYEAMSENVLSTSSIETINKNTKDFTNRHYSYRRYVDRSNQESLKSQSGKQQQRHDYVVSEIHKVGETTSIDKWAKSETLSPETMEYMGMNLRFTDAYNKDSIISRYRKQKEDEAVTTLLEREDVPDTVKYALLSNSKLLREANPDNGLIGEGDPVFSIEKYKKLKKEQGK